MRALRKEEGAALISAIVLITVILGLGLGLLMLGDGQQRAATREQSSERAFEIAEAALNAQIDQLSRVWPTFTNYTTAAPEARRCVEGTSNLTNYCPASVPLADAYGKTSGITCPAGTKADAWGAPITSPWATYVRSAAPNENYFESSTEKEAADYAPENSKEHPTQEEKLWVRAVGVANCREVSLVTLVARQLVSVPFPKDVIGGNFFRTTNKGNKTIVKAEWKGESGEVGMRCEGFATREPGVAGSCQEFHNGKGENQVVPFIEAKKAPSSPILSEEQMESVRAFAESNGTLYSAERGNCPTKMENLVGSPAYVENCGAISISGGGEANTQTHPGFLVVANGSLSMNGNGTFYGAIYMRNPTNAATSLVELGGNITVQGAIEVDGRGGLYLGSSKVNVEYNPESIVGFKGFAGATGTRNTFRVLPISQ